MKVISERRRSSNVYVIQLLFLAVFFFILLIVSYWLINLTTNSIDEVHHQEATRIQNNNQHFILQFLKQLNPVIASLLSGVTTLAWCWLLTYFNWLHVGSFPATPLSPNRKLGSSTRPAVLASSGFIPLAIGLAVTFLVWQHMVE